MYIATVPNRRSPPAILLRESYRDKGKVKTRTIANLTHWAPERVEALRRALKGDFDGMDGEEVSGEIFGVLFALKQLADQVGLTRVLGPSEEGRLALFLVLARIAHGGSRLSAVRWAEQHAVSDILGLEPFDENDLYDALDWLEAEQTRIEQGLYTAYVKDLTINHISPLRRRAGPPLRARNRRRAGVRSRGSEGQGSRRTCG